MAKGPREYVEYVRKVLPWVDNIEILNDGMDVITFKNNTPKEIRSLFNELAPKLKNIELRK